MENAVIHRRIEQHAATAGETPAIVDAGGTLTYRELNQRANAAARYLIDHGFRRGAHARVALPRSPDLAVVLLGILKAGGAYTWPSPVSTIDCREILASPITSSPNLPVLVRPSDVACVLGHDREAVLVPHATLVLCGTASNDPATSTVWSGERGAFDLWAGLLAGATLTIESEPALGVAA